jgi:hypothetical protein
MKVCSALRRRQPALARVTGNLAAGYFLVPMACVLGILHWRCSACRGSKPSDRQEGSSDGRRARMDDPGSGGDLLRVQSTRWPRKRRRTDEYGQGHWGWRRRLPFRDSAGWPKACKPGAENRGSERLDVLIVFATTSVTRHSTHKAPLRRFLGILSAKRK